MSFNREALAELEKFLKQATSVIPYKYVARNQASPGSVAMRHDIDHDLDKALSCAEWEYALGFRSTYFFLHSAPYYEDKDKLYSTLDRISQCGHEIGFHNDALCSTKNNHIEAAALINEELSILRNRGYDIVGAADHGGTGATNEDIWDHYDISIFNLEYEAYKIQRSAVTFISDNRGRWRSPLKFAQTFMLVHPIWWF